MKTPRYFLAALAVMACGIASAVGLDPSTLFQGFAVPLPPDVLGGLGGAFSLDPAAVAGVGAAVMLGETAPVTLEVIKAELTRISGEVKAGAENALKEAKDAGKLSTETKAEVDKLLIKQGELSAKLTQTEQLVAKLEANGAGGDVKHESLGQQFIEDEGVKAFLAKAASGSVRGRAGLTVNAAITTLTTAADGSAGDLVRSTRVGGVLELPQRRMTVRDLIAPGRMDGSVLEYVKETGFTNGAGMVAEGAAKPQSSLTLDLVTTSAKVIAHYMKASRQILSDAAQLASIIDQRLRFGLEFKEEAQLLNGDGVGQNLLGIVPQATAFVMPADPPGTETGIDLIRLALLQAELAEFPSTGIVMNPIDWTLIELLKDTTGRYIIGNPQGTLAPTLWARPVVTTQSMTVDKFLCGAFRMGAQVFDRWQARVEVATENEDDFIKNMVTILAEERLALAVYRPESFVYGDLGRLP